MPDRTIDVAEALLVAAQERGMLISGDGRIGESDLERVLGLGCRTLRHLRAEGRAPAHFRIAVGGARISYRLADVAGWIEHSRDE